MMDDYFWDSFNPEYDEISDVLQTIIDMNKVNTKKGCVDIKKNCVNTDIHIDPTYINKAIKRVILSNPATIILWNDGTKTVTKCCDDDVYDPEIGMAMCIMKHLFGDTNRWLSIIRKYVKNIKADEKKKLCEHDYTKLNNKPVVEQAKISVEEFNQAASSGDTASAEVVEETKEATSINEAECIPSDDEYQIISCIISKDDKNNEDS